MAQSDTRDQPVRDTETGVGAVGGDSLLNIPPCSMAEELGEQSQSFSSTHELSRTTLRVPT